MAVKRYRSQEGFALPIALGVGLTLLLISISMIARSQSDNVAASSQKANARGLSAAETGVSRIQELINQYRPIASYPACSAWSTSNNSCSDTSSSATSWKNPTSIPNLNTGCSGATNGYTSIPLKTTRDWQDIDAADANKGQYRLWNYSYDSASQKGTLIVEGRVNQSGTGTSATTVSSTSISRVQVTIPVVPSTDTAVPGLWIQGGTGTDMKNDKIAGNIVVNACALTDLTTPPTASNLSSSTDYSVKAIRTTIPATPSLPSIHTDLTSNSTGPWQTLPRSGDLPYVDANGVTRYAYLVKDLDKTGNPSMTITSGAKVDLFVQGDILLGGNPNINSSGTPSQLRIFGNDTAQKYGCASGTTCPTTKVQFGGTGTMNAFVYAPAGVGGVRGGGNTNGNFNGSLWIKDWVAPSSNSKIKVDSTTESFSDYGMSNVINRQTLSPISAWVRQQSGN
jgi:Tfp pilus assembly protein PilX